MKLHARSISTNAWDILRSATGTAQVLGQFRRAVDLLVDDATNDAANDAASCCVIALVLPEVGNGPFNIVVAALPDAPLPRHVSLAWTSKTLHIGPWQLGFDAKTRRWNPRPPWDTLTLHPARLAQLRDIAMSTARARASSGSPFVEFLLGNPLSIVTTLGRALAANDAVAIHNAAAAIAGLGPGLTPSGDDFLAGVMLGMKMRSGELTDHASCLLPPASCIFSATAPRTTRLSRAFLHVASQGLADEHWHTLLAALSTENPAQLEHAATNVLNCGASSGLDMVAGFLWQLKAL
ncbi:MAG: DUF2877 domain-containing protein [Anaerolineae bacterium]|nr:DUF2877 domain-containing protein [Anaerolineae bacterium]